MITKKNNIVEIVIPKKFSEKQIGEFMNKFWTEYNRLSLIDTIYIDYTQTEWIANQNLLLLSGVIRYLYNSGDNFMIRLLPDDYNMLNIRKVEQICELWYVWKLNKIFDKESRDFENYIEKFNDNTLRNLCKIYGLNFEKYRNNYSFNLFDDRYSVIPFISLNYIVNANYKNTMEAQINPVYDLNRIISIELENHNCQHPFVSKTISAIITKELYDNFLNHFEKSFFKSDKNWAFMSISLRGKRRENQYSFKCNFEEEELEDSIQFFFDEKSEKYKNENLIQFSFIDFGRGIVNSLQDQYKKEHHILENGILDENEVLKYAFKHNTSRNPILDKYEEEINYIPRGLYDLLVIVKRYKGLLIVRSNYGKIIYNFSNTNTKDNPVFFDTDKKEYFPGTYISIYIPAFEGNFDKSVIQPEYEYLSNVNMPIKTRNINMLSIVSEMNNIEVKGRYKHLIKRLSEGLEYNEKNNWLTYISFWGVTDSNIIKKAFFFLVSSYEVNEHNSIIIVDPPSENIINEINNEILSLDKDQVIQDYKIHPIPLIYLDIIKKEINLQWVGIFIEEDKQKLNDLLYDVHSLILADLKDGYKAVGNISKIDKFGNFSSKLPTERELLAYYETTIVEEAIKCFDCVKREDGSIYLCNSNYYQEIFLQLTDVLNSHDYEYIIPSFLLHEVKVHCRANNIEVGDFNEDIIYIAITASSHKILNALILQKDDDGKPLINENKCLFLDNYLNFEYEIQNRIKSGAKYILVCDAIATGNLTMRLDSMIRRNKAYLVAVAVIVNTLDTSFDGYDNFKEEFIDKKRFIYLFQYPIKKIRGNFLSDEQKAKVTIRINPYTNIPITLSDKITNKDSILLSNEVFLECIDDEDIEIRFKLFNNLIHPYFFKTAEILKKENDKIRRGDYSQSIIYKIFNVLRNKNGYQDADYILYPKKSDIKYLEIRQLQIETKILGRGGINYFELERYNSGNGWKFPHTTEHNKEDIAGKVVLILDDGSCSGDSLYQMVNEVSYYNPKIINVLSIIGRVEDHKREFFSKIKLIRGTERDIEINIYFGTHWHIPTFYQETNPYSDEIAWLDKMGNLSNIPQKIIDNSLKIKDEIRPENDKQRDYKFFPKDKFTEEIPKKEILTIRNEIGKVICFRFYVESFEWFNMHIINGVGKNYQGMSEIAKKHIEELLMCFLYEPYLYIELTCTIPEIKSLVEKIIEDIIFEQNIAIEDLQYKWRKPDIVHLFFIAYQNGRLVEKLNINRFKMLLTFAGNKVNYVLYKLFYYSPLNKEQYREIFAKIKTEILVAYLSVENRNIDKNVKLFNYFIESLPGKGSFRDILKEIHEEYKMIMDLGKHKESIINKIQHLLSCIEAYKVDNTNLIASDRIMMLLEQIISLVNKILSISTSKYKYYFSEYLNMFEGDDTYSLRNIQKRLTVALVANKDFDINILNTDLLKLQKNFFNSESIPYKIFNKITIENIVQKIQEQVNEDTKLCITAECTSVSAYFSEYIFEEIVLKNIFGNFQKYADKSEAINVNIKEKEEKNIEIVITNKTNELLHVNGGFIGTHQIKQLNECPNELFRYSTQKDNDSKMFKQIIVLKKI